LINGSNIYESTVRFFFKMIPETQRRDRILYHLLLPEHHFITIERLYED
jgi:hypothetical protein